MLKPQGPVSGFESAKPGFRVRVSVVRVSATRHSIGLAYATGLSL